MRLYWYDFKECPYQEECWDEYDKFHGCTKDYQGMSRFTPYCEPSEKCLKHINQNEINNNNNKEGDVKMTNNNTNMNFMSGLGMKTSDKLALSMNGGIVVKRADGNYVGYNYETGELVNQMQFVIPNTSNMIFIMPSTEVNSKDMVEVNNKFYAVLKANEDKSIDVVDIEDGTKKTLISETNPFGIKFYMKVMTFMNPMMTFNGENNMFQQMMNMQMFSQFFKRD